MGAQGEIGTQGEESEEEGERKLVRSACEIDAVNMPE
jgi:hypothetical protein